MMFIVWSFHRTDINHHPNFVSAISPVVRNARMIWRYPAVKNFDHVYMYV